MRIPKRYGQSQIPKCPFCKEQAITTNKQKLPVCLRHKESVLQELKCSCGSYLDMKHSKYGPFFVCMRCGPVNLRKALDINGL